jgi:hypothetical protein
MGMSQPVKLSDALVLDARIAGVAQERSIARQVEFWAKLGRSVELLLEGGQVLKLCRSVGATPLADLVDVIDTPVGREKLKSYLESEPYPHFKALSSRAGMLVGAGTLVRIEENGKRTVGRFVNREFIPSPIQLRNQFTHNTLPKSLQAERDLEDALEDWEWTDDPQLNDQINQIRKQQRFLSKLDQTSASASNPPTVEKEPETGSGFSAAIDRDARESFRTRRKARSRQA